MPPKFISIITDSGNGGSSITIDDMKKYVEEQIATAKKYTDEKASSKNFVTRDEGNKWGMLHDLSENKIEGDDKAINSATKPGAYVFSRTATTNGLGRGAYVLTVWRYVNIIFQIAQSYNPDALYFRTSGQTPLNQVWSKVSTS